MGKAIDKISKSNLPKTPDGKIKPSPGRPKGKPNIISGQAKENIAAVFEQLDGVAGMLEWAKTHKDEFYCNIYTKLIPVTLQGKIDAQIESGDERQLLASTMVDALARIVAARQIGGGGVGIIIDNVAGDDGSNESDAPRLVDMGKTGTKAA
jgi:hypothetical protein